MERNDLTRNQRLVFDALTQAKSPLSAYTILDQLRDKGFRAPLQVYRALEQLIALDVVHRLESINAFVACSHPACEDHGLVAFAICSNCGNVTEFSDDAIRHNIKAHMQMLHFQTQTTTLEIRGLCATCSVA